DTGRARPEGSCVQRLFEAQAEKTPLALAVACGHETLTYGELNRRANQLAHFLRARGVGPEVKVGLCVERSVTMLTGLLGILKAGGAFVPLDPAYPRELLTFMLEDARPKVPLTLEHLSERVSGAATQTVRLDADWERIAQ